MPGHGLLKYVKKKTATNFYGLHVLKTSTNYN